MRHKLFLIGDISEELYDSFTKELHEIERKAKDTDRVDIELSSGGGSAYDALAFFDRIRGSPLSIRITGVGYIASAAVLVLAAGDQRRLTKNSWVMVHEDEAAGLKGKKIWEIEKIVSHYRLLENQWCRLLTEVTTVGENVWADLHRNETYLTPEECLDYGLIEEII